MPSAWSWIVSLSSSVCFVISEKTLQALPRACLLPIFAPASSVATRQTSSSGRAKSPRIQVVLPEELCQRLADLADAESRTVSNMAKVLIQQGVERLERARPRTPGSSQAALEADLFRKDLEERQRQKPQRLRGAPRRLRLHRPG